MATTTPLATITSQAARAGSSRSQPVTGARPIVTDEATVVTICSNLNDNLKRYLREFLALELSNLRTEEREVSESLQTLANAVAVRLAAIESRTAHPAGEVIQLRHDVNSLLEARTSLAQAVDLRFTRVAYRLSMLENPPPSEPTDRAVNAPS